MMRLWKILLLLILTTISYLSITNEVKAMSFETTFYDESNQTLYFAVSDISWGTYKVVFSLDGVEIHNWNVKWEDHWTTGDSDMPYSLGGGSDCFDFTIDSSQLRSYFGTASEGTGATHTLTMTVDETNSKDFVIYAVCPDLTITVDGPTDLTCSLNDDELKWYLKGEEYEYVLSDSSEKYIQNHHNHIVWDNIDEGNSSIDDSSKTYKADEEYNAATVKYIYDPVTSITLDSDFPQIIGMGVESVGHYIVGVESELNTWSVENFAQDDNWDVKCGNWVRGSGLSVEDKFYVKAEEEGSFEVLASASGIITAGEVGSFKIAEFTCEKTGLLEIDGKWKYKYEDGSFAINKWIKINNKWSYFDENGFRCTGWKKIGSHWFRFDSNGEMLTSWQKIGENWFHFTSKGYMDTGWKKLGGNWYHFTSKGYMQTGWQTLGGKKYYFDSKGVSQAGWKKIDGVWYHFSSQGADIGWKKLAEIWYHFNSDGKMDIGWKKIGGNWYHFTSRGNYHVGWQYLGGHWYYFDRYGKMQVGWQYLGNVWYYLKPDGTMVTGWYSINGEMRYFDSRGVLIK